ncbi:MAG TPA: adenylosuccinate lyase [Candidatus Binatia bacterium]|nr:adenylosuccinate lyase [Candidatus Binatia bacterium]
MSRPASKSRAHTSTPLRTASLPTDVLAERYASPAMAEIWSPPGKVVLEREFWIAVMRAQRELGVEIPQRAIDAYARVKSRVDLASIQARERVTRHDVKARIEEFCALAGYEQIHKGLTSRDLTENVEQLQIRRSLQLLRVTAAACLLRLAARVQEFRDVVITARTHNVAAQPTTVGRRLAMFGEELLLAFRRLEAVIALYPLRGLKGPVGTQLDQLTLFDGDARKVTRLEAAIVRHLGFTHTLDAPGQVYPRSLDFEVVSAVYQLGAGPSSFAKTWRLMSGYELASEGFQAGQVGSSAMPHKQNARSCERLNGLHVVLRGYLNMVMGLAGDQWNEGDVSCSVVRRVALPGAMMAADGLLQTFLTILDELVIFPEVIAAERDRYLPFLATTTILMAAVRAGAGRERAHAAIQAHAQAAASAMRAGARTNDLFNRLAADPRIGLTRKQLDAAVRADGGLTGAARAQADAFVKAARAAVKSIPEAARFRPRALV